MGQMPAFITGSVNVQRAKRVFCCRVLNAGGKKICLAARSIVAISTPVNNIANDQPQQADDTHATTLTVAEMCSE
jgi:hypothetical protein